jgi:N-methylhydantoinase B
MPSDTSRKSAFTAEIIQSALQAISAEMFDSMRLTAMSPIIYEVLDMGTGILNARGEMASSGAGIPALVGVVEKAVQRFVGIYTRPGEIEEGDIFITNDPYYGGVTHLNDIVLAMPVFADGRLVAWTANSAHWNDVGGSVHGSMDIQATEIFQEGLRLPAVKLASRGEVIRPVLEIIKVNSRMPDFAEGDLWAGIAAVRSGERRLKEVIGKYGCDTFLAVLEQSMNEAERLSLHALKSLPQGRFTLEEPQDDGSCFRVAIEIRGDAMVIDLRDNPDSVKGPLNASRDATLIAAQIAFKAITDPASSANGGSFRPLQVLTRPGSVFEALPPTAQGFYYETLIRVNDLVFRCLAQACPERLSAGSFASTAVVVLGGHDPDTGLPFTMVEPELGGWGALNDRDGNHAVFSLIHGDTFNCPVEVAESRYGYTVDQLALNDLDPPGDGQFCGGRGVVIDYRLRADGGTLTAGFSRSKVPPWGLRGGSDGSPNYVEVRRKDGRVTRHSFESDIPMGKDDVARIVTGNGAGFGPPRQRPPEAVRRDLRDGLISAEHARRVYGIES